jgi:hypothetical protein
MFLASRLTFVYSWAVRFSSLLFSSNMNRIALEALTLHSVSSEATFEQCLESYSVTLMAYTGETAYRETTNNALIIITIAKTSVGYLRVKAVCNAYGAGAAAAKKQTKKQTTVEA